MSQSEQRCRVSWVLSEASSWAEYEHKWCFHSALLPAIWILPQAFISMAAAFSLIPGLCVCISLSLSLWLKCPSQLQLNPFVYLPFPQLDFYFLFTPPLCSPSGSLFIPVFSPTYFSFFPLCFFFFFKPSSFYHFLWSHSLVLVLCCTMIIISFSIQFLIECQHLICPLCLACPISQQ